MCSMSRSTYPAILKWIPLPILADYANKKKKGMKLKKKIPLKLLSQSQPNFAEMILVWSPSKIMSGISDLRPRHSRT